jgi:hypothetical protein
MKLIQELFEKDPVDFNLTQSAYAEENNISLDPEQHLNKYLIFKDKNKFYDSFIDNIMEEFDLDLKTRINKHPLFEVIQNRKLPFEEEKDYDNLAIKQLNKTINLKFLTHYKHPLLSDEFLLKKVKSKFIKVILQIMLNHGKPLIIIQYVIQALHKFLVEWWVIKNPELTQKNIVELEKGINE